MDDVEKAGTGSLVALVEDQWNGQNSGASTQPMARTKTSRVFFYPIRWGLSRKRSFFDRPVTVDSLAV